MCYAEIMEERYKLLFYDMRCTWFIKGGVTRGERIGHPNVKLLEKIERKRGASNCLH